MRIRFIARFVLAAVAVATASCGDVIRQGQAPVVLVVNTLGGAQGSKPGTFGNPLQSDVITNVTSPTPTCTTEKPCAVIFGDVGQVVLSLAPKDASIAPTSNNQVTISRYHVEYTRTDGRNTQGVDVPFAFDAALTGTVPQTGSLTLGFELVRITAKQESPLVELRTNPLFISTFAKVTFYGKDLVGNDISVTSTIQVDFGNFGDP
jgi:hypothetical protein